MYIVQNKLTDKANKLTQTQRPFGFTTYAKNYAATKVRLTPLLAIRPQTLSKNFTQLADSAVPPLRFSTRSTYWTAMMSQMKILALERPPDASRFQTFLETEANKEESTRESCTISEVLGWIDGMPPNWANGVLFTFWLGQRLCDVLRLQRRCFRLIVTTQISFWSVTFYEGKTVGTNGPFSLHFVKGKHKTLDMIMDFVLTEKDPQATVFVHDYVLEKAMIAEEIPKDVRAIRRGGLQRMALAGVPLQQILYYSRHRSLQSLYKYLENGSVLTKEALESSKAITQCSEPGQDE